MNVFDLRGPEFLLFYFILLVNVIALAVLLRWWLRTPRDEPVSRLPVLDAYHVAYLAGSQRNAVHAAITSLVHRGLVKVGGTSLRIEQPLIRPIHPFEQKVYDTILAGNDSPNEIRSAMPSAVAAISAPLEQHELVYPRGWFGPARLVPPLLVLMAAAIAGIKIQIGINRDRPVAILVVLAVVTLALMLGFLSPVHRTGRGDALLRRLKSRNEALKASVSTRTSGMTADDLAMAVGLYGLAAVADPGLADVRNLLHPRTSSSDAGGWGGSCGSSCGSSGSSGCGGGGCGGGGCGGCGG